MCVYPYFRNRKFYLRVLVIFLIGVPRINLSVLFRFGDGDTLSLNIVFASFFCVYDLLPKKEKYTLFVIFVNIIIVCCNSVLRIYF